MNMLMSLLTCMILFATFSLSFSKAVERMEPPDGTFRQQNLLDEQSEDVALENALVQYLLTKEWLSRARSPLFTDFSLIEERQKKRGYWKQCAFNAVSCFGNLIEDSSRTGGSLNRAYLIISCWYLQSNEKNLIKAFMSTSTNSEKLNAISLYLEVVKRGPAAFANLVNALLESQHTDLAMKLLDADGDTRKVPPDNGPTSFFDPQTMPVANHCPPAPAPISLFPPQSLTEDSPDASTGHTCQIQQSEVQHSTMPIRLPEYFESSFRNMMRESLPDNEVNLDSLNSNIYPAVKYAEFVQESDGSLPEKYKMTSNPRGYALIINNILFNDQVDFPTRNGAQNDERALAHLLKQFYFIVECHTNKTRQEMIEIVETFSQKEEFTNIDCVIVVLMSHGKEGESEEDTEIIGIDGIGFKTRDVLSYFYHDNCPSLLHKPKIFIFQSCRGHLLDHGVETGTRYFSSRGSLSDHGIEVERFPGSLLNNRTQTDGKRVAMRRLERSRSDMFIAYPVPPGIKANRDIYQGAWFIQAIVAVFAKHAWDRDLEDLFKIVDNLIKSWINRGEVNFQTVVTRTIGWSKKLYFNPGLHMVNRRVIKEQEGMDVVDTPSINHSQINGGNLESVMDDEDNKRGCFPACRPF